MISATYYICSTCDNLRIENVDELVKHLADVHGIDAETQTFEKQMIVHIDGIEDYQSTYEYTGHGVSFTSHHWAEREKDDMMRYCGGE